MYLVCMYLAIVCALFGALALGSPNDSLGVYFGGLAILLMLLGSVLAIRADSGAG